MNKRLFSLLLCLFLLASLALPAAAETAEEKTIEPILRTISNTAEFLQFAEDCRLDSFSENMQVTLTADIDLTGLEFTGIPIFSGVFDGGEHTISGLNITTDGSYIGLFRYLTETAIVQNLTVEGTVTPQGSRACVGGIAGSNAGIIRSCRFDGILSGGDNIGGIAGINTMTGTIQESTASGTIHGSHFVGGIAGSNSGVIRDCVNHAQVNTTAQQNEIDLADITLDTLTDTETAGTVTDIGGIAGSSSGVIRDCENNANVGYKHMGYNIGGIAGTQSGFLTGCENYGAVSGRKEVGGIAGQMEPAAIVEFDEDALQILQEQLDAMGRITNQTAANMRGSASQITSQVESIQNSIQEAQDAVDALIPNEDNPTLPDADALQAAQNALSNSMTTMWQELQGISATTDSAMGTLSNNLYALQNQISAMSATVGNMSETIGGSIRDVSDLDTETDMTGKISLCQNHGQVLADMNAGGIVGAIAMENDLDPEEDLDVLGEHSFNFESQLRAVILGCENTAAVTAGKQNVGGVAGWVSLGLVKDCTNSGAIQAESADYAGGIAGRSSGYLRGNSAKCTVSGDMYVGGIAGSGTVVTDCRSMVLLTATEKAGSLLGQIETDHSGAEMPISGNYYLSIGSDPGGIDGISYTGLAERLEKKDFLSLEGLSRIFWAVTISFRFEDGAHRTFVTLPGSDLRSLSIPQLPEKAGYTALWEGLEDAIEEPVYFDIAFDALYLPLESTLQSIETAENGKPLLLLTGSFGPDATVTLSRSDTSPYVGKGMTLLQDVSFAVPESESKISARYLLPEGIDTERLRLLVQLEDSVWTEVDFTISGSYAVFPVLSGENTLALVQEDSSMLPLILIAAAVLAAGTVIILLHRKKRSQ